MSLEQAKKLYELFNEHKIDDILGLLTDDVEWNSFGPDWALAIGSFKGHDGVKDFFNKLMKQQCNRAFVPLQYYASGEVEEVVHAIGFENGYLKEIGEAGRPFMNNWDHTFWFNNEGKVYRFRANYNLALKLPTKFWNESQIKHM